MHENEQEKEAQQHRLRNKDKSNATKLAWRRNHAHYISGIKKRERAEMNKSFYDVCREIDEKLNEAQIEKDNVFENSLDIGFEAIAGGLSLSVDNENGIISISTSLNTTGNGRYRLTSNDKESIKNLYSKIKDDLFNLCKNFDNEINQIISKNGLKSTK